jgi:putative ABC transport system permease protein
MWKSRSGLLQEVPFSGITAVVLGVAFMAGTFVLTDTLGNVFDDLFANTTKGVDAVVRAQLFSGGNNGGNNSTRPPVPESLVPTVQAVKGAVSGVIGFAIVAGKDGDFIQNQAPTLGTTWYPGTPR